MERDKAKICVFVPHGAVPSRRGFAPAIVADELVRRYVASSTLMVSLSEGASCRSHARDGVFYEYFSVSPLYKRLFQKITRLDPYPLHARLIKYVERFNAELLHVHQLEFPLDKFFDRLGRALPVVVHAHVTTQKPNRVLADCYIAVSNYVKGRLVEKGFPAERIRVVSNGVDLETFTPASVAQRSAFRAALKLPETAPVLLFFGRKQDVKGFDIFLRTALSLKRKRPDLEIFAIGSDGGEARKEAIYADCCRMREELSALGGFHDLDVIPHGELIRYLQVADLALLPSRAETQGMAVIEAMATGCVTVSTRVGGIPESITDGLDGVLISPSMEPDQIADTIQGLLCDQQKMREIARNAVEKVRREFSWERQAAAMEDIYAALLANGTRSDVLPK